MNLFDRVKKAILEGRGEQTDEATNPYAIGMAAAEKATGDHPPLKKSTIVKAHQIAAKIKKEEVELDEISTNLAISYRGKAGEDKTKDRSKGRKLALDKWSGKAKVPSGKYNEEVETIDELSVNKLNKYRNLARFAASNAAITGDKETLRKKDAGTKLALKKIISKGGDVKEESELDEATAGTGLPKSTSEKNKQYIEVTSHLGYKKKVPVHPTNAYRALNHYRNDPSTKSARIVSEEVVNEARGRPKKDLGYTINPNNKQKLYHDNPAHMEVIKKLRKNKVLPPEKKEPSEHIINRMGQASTNMTGGQHIKYDNGKTHHITNSLAAKTLAHYRSLKPADKEDFQDRIAKSHEDHLDALAGK